MRARAIPLGILVALALLLFWVLGGEHDDLRDDALEPTATRGEEEARGPGLESRAPSSGRTAEKAAPKIPTTTTTSTSRPAVPVPPTVKPKPETVGRLAEATRDDGTASLRVLAVDASGHPRDGAHLVLYTIEQGAARKQHDEPLGADGVVTIEGLKPGRRPIYVRIGSLQRMAVVELVAGRVTEATVPFPLGARVYGVVRHEEKGPQGNVMVRLRRESEPFHDAVFAATDKQGRYELRDIPPGTYAVSLTGASIGYSPRPRCQLVVHAAGSLEHDFVLGQVVLQGTVREAGSRRALGGVTVNLQGGLYVETTTNAQGAYAFRDVAPGEYTVAVSKDGYGFRFLESGPLGEGTTATLDIELIRAALLEIEVVDQNGTPIAGTVILGIEAIEPKDATSLSTNLRSDEQGRLRYARIVPGRYHVRVSSPGSPAVRKEITIQAGTNTHRFELTRKEERTEPVSLTGVVRDAATKDPIPGARIVVQRPRRREALSDARGVYRIRGLPAGTCMLHVGKEGHGIRFVRGIEIEAGQATELDLELQVAAVLNLRLTKADGAPVVGGVVLSITPKRGTQGTHLGTGITADDDGNATYRQIVPGVYTLGVSQEGAGRASIETEVREGTNTLDLRLR